MKKHKRARGKIEVYAELLTLAQNGILKTQMLHAANLVHGDLQWRLNKLQELGLIEHVNPGEREENG